MIPNISDPATYAVLDDQSNRSLGHRNLFDQLKVNDNPELYELRTCAGTTTTSGRRMGDLVIEPLDGRLHTRLPAITECNAIPSNRSEIPTPDAAEQYSHMRAVASKIPALCEEADILLLIGRDTPQLLKVRESRNGPPNAPWAQRTDLGWVIIGDICINGTHRPDSIETFKTHLLSDGRPSLCSPCPNQLLMKGKDRSMDIGRDVFQRSDHDEKPGWSIQDRQFMQLMDAEVHRDETGSWVAPLPFNPDVTLPNNRLMAVHRFNSLRMHLERKPKLKEQYMEFMGKLLARDTAGGTLGSWRSWLNLIHRVNPNGTGPTSAYFIHISLETYVLCSIAVQLGKAFR